MRVSIDDRQNGTLLVILDDHYVGIEIVDLRIQKITAIGGNR